MRLVGGGGGGGSKYKRNQRKYSEWERREEEVEQGRREGSTCCEARGRWEGSSGWPTSSLFTFSPSSAPSNVRGSQV